MKLYEPFYLIGIIIIIIAIALYYFSTTIIVNPEENSASNLLGTITEIDSSFTIEQTFSEVRADQLHRNKLFLWIGIPLGLTLFLCGIIIKRKKEGRDLFIDDEPEDDEAADFPIF